MTPAVMWEGDDIGDWDPKDPAKVAAETEVNGIVTSLGFNPSACHS